MKIRNASKTLLEHLQKVRTHVLPEEMTSHPLASNPMMGVPSNYRGMAKVVGIKDQEMAGWLGMNTGSILYLDMAHGETNLMTPEAEMVSIHNVMDWFSIEPMMDSHKV